MSQDNKIQSTSKDEIFENKDNKRKVVIVTYRDGGATFEEKEIEIDANEIVHDCSK